MDCSDIGKETEEKLESKTLKISVFKNWDVVMTIKYTNVNVKVTNNIEFRWGTCPGVWTWS